MKRLLTLFGLLLCLIAYGTTNAQATEYVRFANTNFSYDFHGAPTWFKTAQYGLVGEGVTDWNGHSVRVAFTFSGGSRIQTAADGNNTIGWAYDSRAWVAKTRRFEFVNPQGERVAECDITLNAYYNFATKIEQVVMHEMGHCLGFGHSDATESVMYPSLSAQPLYIELPAYDVATLCSYYGCPGEPWPVVAAPTATVAATNGATPTVSPVARLSRRSGR